MSSRKKVTQLNPATELNNSDVIHVVNNGVSKKATLEQVKEFAQEGVQTSTDWGDINGDITDQADLQEALAEKSDVGHTHTPSQVGLGNVTNDAQVKRSEMAQPNGVATLGSDGKIPSSQLSALAITDVFVVSSQVAMLALTAEVGDVAVRTDLNKTFILKTAGASTLANWQEMLTPSDAVLSVNGQVGAITLTTSNISEGSNQYFTNPRAVSALTGQNISIFNNNAGYVTSATGLFVNNATNATLTRSGAGPYTLGLNLANANEWTGVQTIRKDALGANSGDGFVFDNQTPATISVQQASPRRRMRGRGFYTNTSQSFPVDFADFVIGKANIQPYGKYQMMQSMDGGAYREAFSYDTTPGGDGFKITTAQAQSNSQAGTTRIATLENSGTTTYVDFTFSGVRKAAIGASSSGEINLHTSGSNGVIVWVGNIGSQSAMHYLYNGGILTSGNIAASGRASFGSGQTNPNHILQVNGRVGYRGRLVKSNVTLSVDDHHVYIDTTNSAQCIGTPTYNCSSFTDESGCSANSSHGGACSWNVGYCYSFNGDQGGCESHAGCTWEMAGCGGFSDEGSCNSMSGCSWASEGHDCGAFTGSGESTCTSYSGCYWSPESTSDCSSFNNNQGSCESNSGCSWSPSYDGDCTAFYDESSCVSNAGCSWDGMNCTGNYYQGNGSCSGMYVSSPASCSGTYYTYACTGSYPTGNCNGTYGTCSGTIACSNYTSSSPCGSETGCSWSTGQTTFLPQITASMNGEMGPEYIIKKVKGSGNITITPFAGDNIDGASSKTITTNYTGYRLHAYVYREDCVVFTDESSCNAQSGCGWNTPCSGYSYDQTTCESNGCSWDYGNNSCYGSAGAYCSGTYTSEKRWHVVGTF